MSSTFGGLNIMAGGLYVQQAALDTVGHNIANANTEGYSRQRVNPATTVPEQLYGGNGVNQKGTGVMVDSITRARDAFADKQMWKESSTLGYSQTSSEALSKMEGVFSEPSDTGVQTVLNQFWTAWQTLSTNASDSGARTAVAQRGVEVVNALQHATQQMKDTAADINSSVVADVSNINQITSGIYALNKQITNIEVGGTDHANDLRDKRDLLVDQLASLVNISVNQDKAGNYSIQSSGVHLVDGSSYTELGTVTTNDSTFGYPVTNVVVAGTGTQQAVNFTNGKVKALIDARDSTTTGIKGYMTSLDTVSKFLLQDFNEVHRAGYGSDNVSGRNFFGANSTTNYQTAALSTGSWLTALQVNPEVTASTSGLAIIAAKTAANTLVVKAGTANTGSGTGSVTTTGTYAGGTSSTAVTVKVASVDGSNNVSGFTYSTDGGKTFSSSPSATATIQGMTITLQVTAPTVVGDTYNFTLSTGNNASGDNAVLLGKRLKTDVSQNLGATSLDAYYSSLIGALGVQSQDAQRLNTNEQTVVDQLTNLRQSTAGVNMDEEMTNMIRFQKSYNAAARVLTTMDEMLDKLINSTGTVGR